MKYHPTKWVVRGDALALYQRRAKLTDEQVGIAVYPDVKPGGARQKWIRRRQADKTLVGSEEIARIERALHVQRGYLNERPTSVIGYPAEGKIVNPGYGLLDWAGHVEADEALGLIQASGLYPTEGLGIIPTTEGEIEDLESQGLFHWLNRGWWRTKLDDLEFLLEIQRMLSDQPWRIAHPVDFSEVLVALHVPRVVLMRTVEEDHKQVLLQIVEDFVTAMREGPGRKNRAVDADTSTARETPLPSGMESEESIENLPQK